MTPPKTRTLLIVFGVIIGLAVLIGISSREPSSSAFNVPKAGGFDIAKFDSLVDLKLRPLLMESGFFSDYRFNDTRTGLTVTLAGNDWYAWGYGNKKDLTGTTWGAFVTLRREAGDSDPICILRIEDKWREVVAGASPLSGVKINR